MRYEFTYQLTPELSRAATRLFFAKVLGWRAPIIVVLYLVLLWILANTGFSRMAVGFFLGAIVLLLIIYVAAYVYRRHLAMGMLGSLTDRTAKWTVDEDAFTLTTQIGTSTLAWPLIKRVVRGTPVWLLYLGAQPIWVPSEGMNGPPGDFLSERVRAAGGRVE